MVKGERDMPTINIRFEYSEEDARVVVADEINKRVRQQFPSYYAPELREHIDRKIRQTIQQEVAALDLAGQVRAVIEDSLAKVLEDTARRQIKDIVRLATRQELAAARAEVMPDAD
jgi:hypothetical protein